MGMTPAPLHPAEKTRKGEQEIPRFMTEGKKKKSCRIFIPFFHGFKKEVKGKKSGGHGSWPWRRKKKAPYFPLVFLEKRKEGEGGVFV